MPTSFNDAVCHHGLVELIARGKGDTEDAGKKREREAAQAVDVERKRNTDCKQTVLCHVSGFSHIKFDGAGRIGELVISFVFVENFILGSHNLVADFIA